ncbi:ketoacyl-synthetase C-terminal extension domain-containing protein [Kutzneria kofuensis]|uniref:ketoacyl-synthetase C-terminal extension domain-containing protein n=1 Tax=Kutzneria kofuensis TaxID=103725 RepID=UPI0031E658E1
MRPWPRQPGSPRRAGVSSFGVGGTNAHVVLQEAPEPDGRDTPARDRELIVWSAMDGVAADQLRESLAGYFADLAGAEFADAAHTLRVGRTPRPYRGAVLARDGKEAAELLRADNVSRGNGSRPVWLRFAPMGPEQLTSARRGYHGEPVVRTGCDAAFDLLRQLLDVDLRALWLADDGPIDADALAPLQFVVQYTFAHYLIHLGVRPALLTGQGIGELVAAAVAGVFGMADGLRIAAALASGSEDRYADALAASTPRLPRRQLAFASTGGPVPAEDVATVSFWAAWRDREAHSGVVPDDALVVEIGAGTVDEALVELWTAGQPIDFGRRDAGRGYRRVPAPGYPYQRTRHWVDVPAQPQPARPAPETDDVAGVLLSMCAQTLDLPELGHQDDLLDLGVDSFGAIRVAMCVQERFGVELDPITVFELGTVERIARTVTESRDNRTAAK